MIALFSYLCHPQQYVYCHMGLLNNHRKECMKLISNYFIAKECLDQASISDSHHEKICLM